MDELGEITGIDRRGTKSDTEKNIVRGNQCLQNERTY